MSQQGVGRASDPSLRQEVRTRSKPLEHVIDPEKRLVVVTFGTCLSMRDIERYARLLESDPRFRPEFSEIVDLSEVEELDLEGDDFIKVADQVDPFSPNARRAFVARSSAQKHAARMHKILRSNRNIEIFPSVEAAKGWLES